MNRIGMATIGQSPRDDLVPHMQELFRQPVEIVQIGALDDLTTAQIAAYGPDADEVGIVARLRDGSSVLLSHAKIMPRMQSIVDDMNVQGCRFVVILCGADWKDIRSDCLVVNPGRLFPALITALAGGRRLGVIKPSAGQVESERARYAGLGIEAIVTSASPYTGAARLDAVRTAAQTLHAANVDLVWMTCVGMDDAMRRIVETETGKPVILARTILARVVDELLAAAPAAR
jgi:protein AroM